MPSWLSDNKKFVVNAFSQLSWEGKVHFQQLDEKNVECMIEEDYLLKIHADTVVIQLIEPTKLLIDIKQLKSLEIIKVGANETA